MQTSEKTMKNKKGTLIVGVMLLLSSFMALYNYSSKGCVTYFQGVTQCGNSALFGIFAILSIAIFLIFTSMKKH
jgi:hypothetical protein